MEAPLPRRRVRTRSTSTRGHRSTPPSGHRTSRRPLRRLAQTEMHARVAGREIAAVGPHAAPERRLPGALDADPARRTRSGSPGPARSRTCSQWFAGCRLVEQQPHGPAVVRDDDVGVAVVVDVAERRAAADLRAREGRPAAALTSPRSGRLPVLWNSWFLIRNGRGWPRCASMTLTAPLATKRSSQPSLS